MQNILENAQERMFETTIRLGVTGLSRAGKTVFITSLIANLLERGRLTQVPAIARGSLAGVYLRPQPNDTLPRFAYEQHLGDILGTNEAPKWPQSTRAISQLRLTFKIHPQGFFSGMRRTHLVHLDIVDYPGEWLLDLPMLKQSYQQWSQQAIEQAKSTRRAKFSQAWRQLEIDPDAPLDETMAQTVAGAYTDYLRHSHDAGLASCSPGRFLLPAELEGSPVLTFAPLLGGGKKGSLYHAFERRFESYKSRVIKPFFRDHLAGIDRQVVLMDVLGAMASGPAAVHDLRQTMVDVLTCFKVGKNGMFSFLFGRSVDRILFAATKADHLHHSQHGAMSRITDALLTDASDRAEFSGAQTQSLALAALRTTVEQRIQHQGQTLDAVRGRVMETGKQAVIYAGELPEDPKQVLLADPDQAAWLNAEYQATRFLPAKNNLRAGDGPPHIRLDRAIEFLIGDKLQ
ncbi:hypothetical protein GCM10007939_23860 [Amylibacter marinus]|uniref:YcjX family protein n=1 Tax=Amylibacter marinus TaxID=1475483 RepID=A0ABQ5VXE9_9RHOB|nr:YcjX family protein [Amylibacter marinus]GLQ36102.1 hypothetical protein GCM10007939_23860 [Amylibacter marinus]